MSALAALTVLATSACGDEREDTVATSPATAAAGSTAATDTAPDDPAVPVETAAAGADSSCPAADGSSERRTSFTAAPDQCIDPGATYAAVVTTNHGSFTIALDTANSPITVNNFVTLSRYHYYDGTGCHRVIAGFVVQCGRPGQDESAPGYTIADELPQPGAYAEGVVAMANTGQPNSGGGQWFVITGPNGASLPPSYSIVGTVSDGYETTVKTLEALADPNAPNGVGTLEPIEITSIEIVQS
jgi:cyclophilin family peptidyl-prolyl cis-trans isomerase